MSSSAPSPKFLSLDTTSLSKLQIHFGERYTNTQQLLRSTIRTTNNNNINQNNMESLTKLYKDFKFDLKLKQHDRRHKRWLRSYGEQLPKASKPAAKPRGRDAGRTCVPRRPGNFPDMPLVTNLAVG